MQRIRLSIVSIQVALLLSILAIIVSIYSSAVSTKSTVSVVVGFSMNMNMNMNNPDKIRKVLMNTKTIALVGASHKPKRPANYVMKYLLEKGYTVIPINPGLEGQELYGQKVYGSLSKIPLLSDPSDTGTTGTTTIDMIDIFRNSDTVLPVVEEVIQMMQDHSGTTCNVNKRCCIWMQVGVKNEEAAELANQAGLDVVMDACPKLEYPKFNIKEEEATSNKSSKL
mmetsp:Transcript_14537/g.16291  ORF Transcript_14537/g.16291 Transcript_14537/m.16291 type:complete len:225 (+) Transcript_14537:29-703(+)